MSSSTPYTRIRSLLAEQMARLEDYIQPDTELVADLGMDELDAVEIGLTLGEDLGNEDLFTEELDLDLLVKLKTVQGLADWFASRSPQE